MGRTGPSGSLSSQISHAWSSPVGQMSGSSNMASKWPVWFRAPRRSSRHATTAKSQHTVAAQWSQRGQPGRPSAREDERKMPRSCSTRSTGTSDTRPTTEGQNVRRSFPDSAAVRDEGERPERARESARSHAPTRDDRGCTRMRKKQREKRRGGGEERRRGAVGQEIRVSGQVNATSKHGSTKHAWEYQVWEYQACMGVPSMCGLYMRVVGEFADTV